jgi:VCBS repeat protein/Calx-beta domain-containing protein/FG-GAP repeat protein/putative extracellular protein
MWFRASSAARKARHTGRATAAASRRLLLEGLEDRRVMAFVPAANYPVGAGPQEAIAADFNNDGRLDLATASNSDSSVSVLLGNSDGTFQAAQTSPTGSGPLSLASGDFNGDGKLDLVTANAADVSVLLGNGGGSFAAPASIGVGSTPSSVAVGDFNADGKMDLAVGGHTSYYIPPWGSCGYYGCYGGGGYWVDQASVSVLMGNGSGGFGAETFYQPTGGSTTALAAVDLNGDGLADLAAATSYGSIAVLLGTGATGLSPNPIYTSSPYAQSLVAADTNGDSKLDLVAANGYGVGVLLGNGLGSFTYDSTRFYSAGPAAQFAGVADFNGDGKADIATANADGSVSVLLGTGLAAGGSAFKPPVIIAGAGSSLGGLAIGNFNADTRPDLAATNAVGNSALVLLNDGLWPALDAPAIAISDAASVTEGNTGTVNANFTVSLSAAYGQPVSVVYSTADNSALAGSDYQSQTATLTFAPGETSKIVSIAVNGDRLGESDEFFYVKLTGSTNSFIADGSGTGTILDDEPYAWIGDSSITEGNDGTKNLTFTVTLSAAYDADVTIDYATLDMGEEDAYYYGVTPATAGVDYVASAAAVRIPQGQTTGAIDIPIIGDRVPEWTEGFYVELTGSDFAKASGFAIGTIIDDEPQAYISTYPYTSAPEGNTGTSPMTFTVVLSNAYDLPVTVSYATTNGSALAGSDYVATSGSVTFNPGETSQSIVVPIIGDTVAEYDEYLGVNLTAATNATFLSGTVFGYILDDDTPPTVSIGDASIVEGNSGTSLMTFVVSLSNPSGQGISVNFATVNGTAKTSDNDYIAQSGSLYFAPGQTSQTIQIGIKGDTRKEQNETFQVKLSGPYGASISDGQGTGTIINDDAGGKGNGKGNMKLSSAAAVDSALADLLTPTSKKRGR